MFPLCFFPSAQPGAELLHVFVRVFDLGGEQAQGVIAVRLQRTDQLHGVEAELQHNTGLHYDSIYIVGGGAKNAFLNALTEKASGKKVVALPIEATAIGNLKIQMNVQ